MRLTGLYGVTDPWQIADDSLERKVTLALEGGMKILQIREKEKSDEEVMEIVGRLSPLCRAFKVPLILNDRVDLAARTEEVDGVHIGGKDMTVGDARKRLGPSKLLGVSCYGDLDAAEAAQEAGADYVAFGSFYPSFTKPESGIVPKEVIREAKQRLTVPVCAIGGLTAANAPLLAAQGADMIAAVSGLWLGSVKTNAQAYSNLFKERI